jgi:hypothetical protein
MSTRSLEPQQGLLAVGDMFGEVLDGHRPGRGEEPRVGRSDASVGPVVGNVVSHHLLHVTSATPRTYREAADGRPDLEQESSGVTTTSPDRAARP